MLFVTETPQLYINVNDANLPQKAISVFKCYQLAMYKLNPTSLYPPPLV